MRGMNRVFLMGYLGQSPELLISKNGKQYTKINLAVSRRQRTENGEFESKTDWHRVIVWGKTAQNCCDHLERGAPVAVEGALTQIKSIDSTKGTEVTQTLVTADEVHFLPRREKVPLSQGIQ